MLTDPAMFDLPQLEQLVKLFEMPIDIKQTKIISFKINSWRLEWVFGQSFDEHQDQFVTLNNRNLTKIILEKFDTEA